MTSAQNHDHLIHLHGGEEGGGGGGNFDFQSSSSSSSSFRFPRPDENFVPIFEVINTHPFRGGPNFEEINTDPFRGVPTVKIEEGRCVLTYESTYLSADGKPIEIVEYLPLDAAIPSVPTIERDLSLLNLSSSSLPSPQFPFPWVVDTATDGYVKILSVDEITSKLGIREIRGEVECTNCHQKSTIGFDLKTKSFEIGWYVIYRSRRDGFFYENRWLNPNLTPCRNCCCSDGHLKPVIPEGNDIRKINWLFLFLGEMLGCCTIEQLNLFCKHNTSDCHYREFCGGGDRDAKDRLLYLAYVTFCNHLYPTGPFNNSYLYQYRPALF